MRPRLHGRSVVLALRPLTESRLKRGGRMPMSPCMPASWPSCLLSSVLFARSAHPHALTGAHPSTTDRGCKKLEGDESAARGDREDVFAEQG